MSILLALRNGYCSDALNTLIEDYPAHHLSYSQYFGHQIESCFLRDLLHSGRCFKSIWNNNSIPNLFDEWPSNYNIERTTVEYQRVCLQTLVVIRILTSDLVNYSFRMVNCFISKLLSLVQFSV